ncbi:MAG: hypothetical protein HGA76_06905, partial [Candidatus Firestonebacteria bacterium]|nr:hypothetical protein [Candidatus Firestonebacteria bacterium]
SAPLAQARAFLQSLPSRTLLVFPRHDEGHALAYLQAFEGLRPDVRLQAFSAVWPSKPYTGVTVLELLGITPEARQRRRLNFSEYWNQQLRAELTGGGSAYLLTTQFSPDPGLDEFLRTFELTGVRALETRASHEQPQSQQMLIFALTPRARPESAERPPGRPQGVFPRNLRLLKVQSLTADNAPGFRSCLSCRLLWEPWPERKLPNHFLEFTLAEAGGSAGVRSLGQRPLVQAPDPQAVLPDCFWETYQFFLPAGLPAGHYRLYAALWDAGLREWIPAAKTQDPSGYGVVVGEFSVEAGRP